MRDEPLERLAQAQPTLRNLQRLQAPGRLQLMASLDQARAEIVGMPAPVPEPTANTAKQRIGH